MAQQTPSFSACEQITTTTSAAETEQKNNKATGTKRSLPTTTTTISSNSKKKRRKSANKKFVPNLAKNEKKRGEEGGETGGYQDGVDMMSPCRPPNNLEVTVKNGIRYLQPYWGLFRGYTKQRWLGKTLDEVYSTEFNTLLHPLYAKAACRKGRIFVNKRPIFSADHRFRENEFIIHINHRHETEIPNLPIEILAETDDVLVLNKPAGLPVHPCGNYAVHSVLGLLRRDHGRYDELLRCLYRLDRTTTGVLMFAKNEHYDSHFKKLIRERRLIKEYVCKVEGKFPDGEIICDAPLGVLCPQMGLRCVRPDGQEALSSFSLLRYLPAENASVVSCTIVTGRTHQIRVHLQFLGHPIVGDRLYNDETWGPDKGKAANFGGRTMEQLANDIGKRHSKRHWIIERDDEYEQRIRQIGDDENCAVDEFDLKNLEASLAAMPAWDPLCWGCAIKKKREMHESDWLMSLHCHRYSGDGWAYEAPLPHWALVEGEHAHAQHRQTNHSTTNNNTSIADDGTTTTTTKMTADEEENVVAQTEAVAATTAAS